MPDICSADTVISTLRRCRDRFGDRGFLDFSGDTYSRPELDLLSNRLAHGLRALGVRPGDTVATLLDTGVDAPLCWWAGNKLGAIWVPVNPELRGEFLRHQLADSGASLVVCEADLLAELAAVAERLDVRPTVLYRGTPPDGSPAGLDCRPLARVFLDDDADPGGRIEAGDLTAILYTSGTTGPAKGCMISHGYLLNLARQALRLNGQRADEVFWTPMPLFHMYGIANGILGQLMLGATAAIAPRFSVRDFWPEIERTGASVVALMGAMIPLIAQAPEHPAARRCHGRVRHVWGVPFGAELQRTYRRRFGVATAGGYVYGSTEASPVCLAEHGERPPDASAGRAIADCDVRLVGEHDAVVPTGEVGRVEVRPRTRFAIFEGYWKREAETARAFSDGWFRTGDLGRLDPDGYFYFVDRNADLLRRRGENISSSEVEAVFLRHPAIAEAAVHSVPCELAEDDVKLTAVLEPAADISPEDLCGWSVQLLPHFAVPRYVEFRPELPRNAVGRVLKYRLRADAVTPATWDRERSAVSVPRRAHRRGVSGRPPGADRPR